MPAYNSVFNGNENSRLMCGIPQLPFKTNKIPNLDPSQLKSLKDSDLDIVDESLMYFRANVFFKNFPLKGDADKVLVYTTVFIQKCLEVIASDSDVSKAKNNLRNLIENAEYNPNLKGHFFNSLVTVNNSEVSELQNYLKSIRKEVVNRLQYLLYDALWGSIDLKFWLAFGKKKFMGYEMPCKK